MSNNEIEPTGNIHSKGNRDLDSPVSVVDLKACMSSLCNEKNYLEGSKNTILIFKTSGMRILMIALKKGAELKPHSAPGAISVQTLEGEIGFITGGQCLSLKKDQVLMLQSGLEHGVLAKTDAIFLLTISSKLEND